MPKRGNPTAGSDQVSWNSLDRSCTESRSHSSLLTQLPPIIALHLWQPEELAIIETAAMVTIAVLGGASHG